MSVFEHSAIDITGSERSLGDYRGQVLLIVNVASRCGFTPQYTGLEALYRKYGERGFQVLGFPCNQFGKQEPGSETEIQDFCNTTYDVSFPLFSKVDVNGPNAHPLFEHLKAQAGGGEEVKWNFTKFLVDGQGAVSKRFEPEVTPESIDVEIAALL
jgi:glutathione peroxidase